MLQNSQKKLPLQPAEETTAIIGFSVTKEVYTTAFSQKSLLLFTYKYMLLTRRAN